MGSLLDWNSLGFFLCIYWFFFFNYNNLGNSLPFYNRYFASLSFSSFADDQMLTYSIDSAFAIFDLVTSNSLVALLFE